MADSQDSTSPKAQSSQVDYLSEAWFEDDRIEYNRAVSSLPTLSSTYIPEAIIRHIAFQGEEIARLRQVVKELAQRLPQTLSQVEASKNAPNAPNAPNPNEKEVV